MVRIYIENQELDVMQDFSHQITYAIDDIRNIDSKATTFSKTIVLPGTTNNNKLLGNIFELTNANFTIDDAPNVGYNFNAAKSAQARIEVNGLQVMKGVMRLLEIIVDGGSIEYEIALFGELGGFINALGSKKLTGNEISSDDLDFTEYNHNWNITNITDSWNRNFIYNIPNAQFISANNLVGLGNAYITNLNIGDSFIITDSASNNGTFTVNYISYFQIGSVWNTMIYVNESFVNEIVTNIVVELPNSIGKGYVYPLIDYGNVSPDVSSVSIAKHDYQYRAFRPALFVREILEKIIANAGYSFESKFFNTQFFNRLIIPNNDRALLNRSTSTYVSGIKNSNTTFTFSGSSYEYDDINFTPTINSNFTGSGGFYTCNAAFDLNVKISGTINYDGTLLTTPLSFKILKNNTINLFSIPFNSANNGSFSFSIETSFSPNDTIAFYIVNLGTRNPPTRIIIKSNSSFQIDKYPIEFIEQDYNSYLNMNDTLPRNIFQKDFFINILKMFNLYVVEDKYTEKHLLIEPYVDFYDTGNYLDWTEKVDRSQPIRIKPMSELSSRYYEFKYKSDSDYYNEKYRKTYIEGYGDRLYDNLFEFTTEKQTNEVIFSATPLVGYEDRDKVVSTIFKMNNNVEEATEHNIRILQYNLIEDVTSWKIQNGTTTLGTYTSYPYAGHLDSPDLPSVDLNFGATKELYFTLLAGALSNNMFNAYYSPYMAEITDKDSRLVTVKMKFNEIDIFNLDFKRLIFIDNVVYRLSKIIDYSLNELCNVELLRVINTTYYDIPLPVLELGMEYQGGIIAYLDETGQHGIIIPIFVDYINYANWSHNYNTFWGITSTDYGDGITNTAAIIANDTTGLSTCAAEFCSNLNSGGYTDWVLPTRDDLSNIWSAGQIPSALNYSYIWTSSEINSTEVISFNTTDGSSYNMVKYGLIPVLPIRYF